MNLNQLTINVRNIGYSVEFYKKLGLELIVLEDHYARFICPNGDSTFSLHLSKEEIKPSGIVIYFECDDLDDRVSELKSKGVLFETEEILEQPWLWREIYFHDPDNHRLCLFYADKNRKEPPWRINA